MRLNPVSCALNLHRIHSAEESEFSGLVSIYRASLPISEQKSIESLAAMVESLGYIFLAAKQNDAVIGFSITRCFTNSDACLLEYMAISQHHRGRGVGAYLFAQTVQQQEVAERYVLVEVDSNKAPAPPSSDESRRKMFYRRLGCREIAGLSYIMPPVLATQLPPAMELLVYKRTLPASVKKSRFRQWLQCCYAQVYQQPAEDPRIDAMLKELPDDIRLV